MNTAIKQNKLYNYADYLTWDDDERWELIEGVPFNMTPAPLRKHQDISIILETKISNFLKDKPCKMYHAPFDVRFSEKDANDQSISNVVQPDIVIICNQDKLDERGCNGAPDLIIEIISPSTAAKDSGEKLNLYEKYKVKEYLIVYPEEKMVMQFSLNEKDEYSKPITYGINSTLQSKIFSGLEFDIKEIFDI